MHLVGFIMIIYHDERSTEPQSKATVEWIKFVLLVFAVNFNFPNGTYIVRILNAIYHILANFKSRCKNSLKITP